MLRVVDSVNTRLPLRPLHMVGRAVKLLRRGVDMNDADCCFELGKLCEAGTGVARSLADAERLYKRWASFLATGVLLNGQCNPLLHCW